MRRVAVLTTICTACVFGLILLGRTAQAVQPRPAASEQAAAITAYVASRLAVDSSEIHVKVLRPAMGREAEVGAEVIEVREATPGVLLGRTAFVLTVAAEGQPPTPRVVMVDVERLAPVVVATKRLNRFQVITGDDLDVRATELRGPRESYVAAPEPVVGKRAARSIGKDRPVTVDAVEDAPLIRRGDRVTLRLQSGSLTIIGVGRAKGDGLLGRQIPVTNVDSNKVVYGRVVDASTVAVWVTP
ncbi:MAG: flagellar basal body P-ring formation protein FlgA [Nitrospirae bacterium]|nr:flagellar basal body P-ring formation protein FlgA [Nitrospirota bacterium]